MSSTFTMLLAIARVGQKRFMDQKCYSTSIDACCDIEVASFRPERFLNEGAPQHKIVGNVSLFCFFRGWLLKPYPKLYTSP